MAEVDLVREHREPLDVHIFDAARSLGVDVFVTDRSGGVSAGPFDSLNLGDHVGDEVAAVAENRRRLARAAGVDVDALVIVRQVHGGTVLDAADVTPNSEADGLVTAEESLALCVLVADCVPVAIVDTISARVAVVHAGWRGLSGNVIANALSRFGDRETLYAFVGPSVSSDVYQVGPEVAAHFVDVEGALARDVDDRFRLDLRRVTRAQLVAGGLRPDAVQVARAVTDGGTTFFSDRAQRPCGRFALVARRRGALA
jgi:YfiH family protein